MVWKSCWKVGMIEDRKKQQISEEGDQSIKFNMQEQ